jgi:hypothetical protein
MFGAKDVPRLTAGEVTAMDPLLAAVMRPCASTVKEPSTYDPGDTEVFARAMVPVLVMGPPVRPMPVATDVTEPAPPVAELQDVPVQI